MWFSLLFLCLWSWKRLCKASLDTPTTVYMTKTDKKWERYWSVCPWVCVQNGCHWGGQCPSKKALLAEPRHKQSSNARSLVKINLRSLHHSMVGLATKKPVFSDSRVDMTKLTRNVILNPVVQNYIWKQLVQSLAMAAKVAIRSFLIHPHFSQGRESWRHVLQITGDCHMAKGWRTSNAKLGNFIAPGWEFSFSCGSSVCLGAKFQPYNPIVSISASTKEWYDLLHDDNDGGDVRDFGFNPILLLFSSYLTCKILSHKCCVCSYLFLA